ncbi:hypothetical protein MTO96_005738 [Rhipicephalus appendiculatus]|uniref:Uncharacterized protein n=1 Tax=Rhipicephalus appendiculatus TaxID=34631 RepID=A0A131YB96_RHIAP
METTSLEKISKEETIRLRDMYIGFLLGAQALTTSKTTAAAAASSFQHRFDRSPYRRRRCFTDRYPARLLAVSRTLGELENVALAHGGQVDEGRIQSACALG